MTTGAAEADATSQERVTETDKSRKKKKEEEGRAKSGNNVKSASLLVEGGSRWMERTK